MSNPGSGNLKRVAELTNIIQMDHACNIQFTSGDFHGINPERDCLVKGTTGKPKGVTLSHHNLVNNAHQIGHRIGYNEKV